MTPEEQVAAGFLSDPKYATFATGPLQSVVTTAAVLALVVSAVMLLLYKYAVRRSMLSRSSPGDGAAGPRPEEAPRPAATAMSLSIETGSLTDRADPRAAALAARAFAGPRRNFCIYAVAGLLFAVTVAAAHIVAAGLPFSLLMLGIFTLGLTWPILIAAGILWSVSWPFWIAGFLVWYVVETLVIIGSSVAFPGIEASFFMRQLTANLFAVVVTLCFMARWVRSVGPVIFVFLTALLLTLVLVLAGSSNDVVDGSSLFGKLVAAAMQLGLGERWARLTVSLAALAICLVLAMAFTRGLGWLYEQRWISDQSMAVDSIFLIAAVQHGMVLAYAGARWFLAAVAAFVVYKLVVMLLFRAIGRDGDGGEVPDALLLRVFALGRHSRFLFDAFAEPWRHVGRLRLIAGPDLATTTVEPHEFLDFVGGRLSRQFISGPEALEARLDEVATGRDHDGRFRVGDFFCHDDTWRLVLRRLVADSDVVVMDLRGFGAANKGCIFEISELLAVVPLRKIVFLVDRRTDEAFLRQSLRQGWASIPEGSVNARDPTPAVLLFPFKGRRELGRLMVAVCHAATA